MNTPNASLNGGTPVAPPVVPTQKVVSFKDAGDMQKPPKAKPAAKAKTSTPAKKAKPDAVAKIAKKAGANLETKKTAKTAKKAESKKDAGPTGVRYVFDLTKKVIWTAEGNPCREGTARHARVEKVRKAAGRTVGSLLESGCKPRTLHVCVERKWARVG